MEILKKPTNDDVGEAYFQVVDGRLVFVINNHWNRAEEAKLVTAYEVPIDTEAQSSYNGNRNATRSSKNEPVRPSKGSSQRGTGETRQLEARDDAGDA